MGSLHFVCASFFLLLDAGAEGGVSAREAKGAKGAPRRPPAGRRRRRDGRGLLRSAEVRGEHRT